MFVASIKVDYCCNRQKYTDILQEIATQIPNGKIPLFTTARVSELETGESNNQNASACPEEGAQLPDGTLYTGSYLYKQRVSTSVTPHHNNIFAIQEEG